MAFFWLHTTLHILLLLNNVQPGLTQSCWRNTPCSSIQASSFPGEWEKDNFAPSSRTVVPSAVLDTDSGKRISTWPVNGTTLRNGQAVTFDFGFNVGGIATVNYTVPESSIGTIGLAFSESKTFIGRVSDSSSSANPPGGPDGAIYAFFSSKGNFSYVMPDEKLRGGFRYMTLFLFGEAPSVTINDVSLEISFQPTWSNLRAYGGYFHSNDKLLNRIWYSGAYTIQMDSIHPSTGRSWGPPSSGGWANNGQIGPGDTIITDGAKRDRTVWPGDLGVALPSALYSTGELESFKNGLQSLYNYQDTTTGQFPYSGPPLLATGSDTFHMWTMIGTYNYALFSDDLEFVRNNWDKYLSAMKYALGRVDPTTGLFNVTTDGADWGQLRSNGTTTSSQAIFYQVLKTGATLADWIGNKTTVQQAQWLMQARNIQELTQSKCWDASVSAFGLSSKSMDIHPQDANSLAVLFGIVEASSDQAKGISTYLTKNWTPIGAEPEELPGEIAPFISSFEIQAHLLAGETQRALDFIRTSWGWYLNNENGTQSTMVEGYLVNGTFGYRWDLGYNNDFSYTSHAHGWSTGPVSALTEYVLGLSITSRAGKTWKFAPQAGDLTSVEGGFTTSLGKFSANWLRHDDETFDVNFDAPIGTVGEVVIPIPDNITVAKVVIDGVLVENSQYSFIKRWRDDLAVRIRVQGGKHSILVR